MSLSNFEKRIASEAMAVAGALVLERLLMRSSYDSIVVAIYDAMQRQRIADERTVAADRHAARIAANTPWNTPARSEH